MFDSLTQSALHVTEPRESAYFVPVEGDFRRPYKRSGTGAQRYFQAGASLEAIRVPTRNVLAPDEKGEREVKRAEHAIRRARMIAQAGGQQARVNPFNGFRPLQAVVQAPASA
jgi:hypothetical protein